MATSKREVSRFQGMHVFWQLEKPRITNKHEAALALTHWLLVGNGYRCIGRDAELPTTRDPSRTGTETLPEQWNDRSATGYYSLLYVHPEQSGCMFLVKLIPAASIEDEVILGQILRSKNSEDVVLFEMPSDKFIPDQWNGYPSPTSFPNFKAFTEFVDKDIISKLRNRDGETGSGSGFRRAPAPRSIPPEVPNPSPFAPLPAPPLSEFVPPGRVAIPSGIGSRDLDPFFGRGGNIYGPRDVFPGAMPGSGVNFPGRPYRFDPPGPPEFMPRPGGSHPGIPFGVGPRGMGQGFPGSSGMFGVNPLLREPAPNMRPFEPDPDHELPPPGPLGDDASNMFM